MRQDPGDHDSQRLSTDPGIYLIEIEQHILERYGQQLGVHGAEAALLLLAEAVAASPLVLSMPDAHLVVRQEEHAGLVFIGRFDQAERERLQALAPLVTRDAGRLRYVSYQQAERDCEQLAAQLVDQFGIDALRSFHFTAIPRGGHIVLGMLVYTLFSLGIKRAQLEPPHPKDTPLVVVDDWAHTGMRFGQFLQNHPRTQVIFTPLYSHPHLREAIRAQEPQVLACLSATDLQSFPLDPVRQIDPGLHYYWWGKTEHMCFAWSEPARFFWNPATQEMESGWRIVPPRFCLKNRLPPGAPPLPVYVQPQARGPLMPTEEVVFGEFEDQVVIGDLQTKRCLGLSGMAADAWRQIIALGDRQMVLEALLRQYAVKGDALRADLEALLENLLDRGLLTDDPHE